MQDISEKVIWNDWEKAEIAICYPFKASLHTFVANLRGINGWKLS